MFDLIIIGGSSAATAAGIYAARHNLNFKIICKEWGGEVALNDRIENYPGFLSINGLELSKAFKNHVESFGVKIEEGILVENIKKSGAEILIKAVKDNGENVEYKTKTVIIATGGRPKELNITGEKEFRNKGVSYCAVCDGPVFKGKKVAVIGGGLSAMESAMMLSNITKEVYLINKNPKFKGDKIWIDKIQSSSNIKIIYNGFTQKIFGDKMVEGLEYKDENGDIRKIEVDGVFIRIGLIPNSNFIDSVEKNEFGNIKINNKSETSVPGIFAAGDVADAPYKQIVIAMGQGAAALLSAVEYLNKI